MRYDLECVVMGTLGAIELHHGLVGLGFRGSRIGYVQWCCYQQERTAMEDRKERKTRAICGSNGANGVRDRGDKI